MSSPGEMRDELCNLAKHLQGARPFLLDCVVLATTLADITPISQISKLSFKTMYISQDHLLVLVNHRSGI